jgi:hypothetical protein
LSSSTICGAVSKPPGFDHHAHRRKTSSSGQLRFVTARHEYVKAVGSA